MRELWTIALFRIKVQLRAMFKMRGSTAALVIVSILGIGAFFVAVAAEFGVMFFALKRLAPHIATAFFAFQVVPISVLVMLRVIPSLSADLFDQKSVFNFMLYLPIRRATLLVSAFLTSVSAAFLPMVVVVGLVLSFLVVFPEPAIIFGVAGYFVFVAGLSFWGAVPTLHIFPSKVGADLSAKKMTPQHMYSIHTVSQWGKQNIARRVGSSNV